MSPKPRRVSRRVVLRLILGQGEKIRIERDRVDMEQEQESALAVARPKSPRRRSEETTRGGEG